jgi:hypothetical protein
MILVSSSSSSRFSIYAACALLPWSELIYGSARPINSHSAARSERKPVFWGLGRPSAVKMGVVHLDALIYACNESMSAVNKALHTLSTWHRVSACMCSRGRPDRPTAAATSCRSHHLALNSSSRSERVWPSYFVFSLFFQHLAPHSSFRRRRSHEKDYGVFDEHASVDCRAESVFFVITQIDNSAVGQGIFLRCFCRVRLVAFCGRVCN